MQNSLKDGIYVIQCEVRTDYWRQLAELSAVSVYAKTKAMVV